MTQLVPFSPAALAAAVARITADPSSVNLPAAYEVEYLSEARALSLAIVEAAGYRNLRVNEQSFLADVGKWTYLTPKRLRWLNTLKDKYLTASAVANNDNNSSDLAA